MQRIIVTSCMFLCLFSVTRFAAACDPYSNTHSGLPYFAYGHSGSLYGLGYVPVPPYFALHPPVHYSYREKTPYGANPRLDTRCADRLAPQVIINHLAPAPQTDPYKMAGIIINPYYQPSESPGDEVPQPRLVKPKVRKPIPQMLRSAKPPTVKKSVAKPQVVAPTIETIEKPETRPPTLEESPTEKPTVDRPTIEKPPVAKPPVAKPPVAKPAVAKPTVAKPTVAKPTVEKPTVEKAGVEKPSTEEPAIE